MIRFKSHWTIAHTAIVHPVLITIKLVIDKGSNNVDLDLLEVISVVFSEFIEHMHSFASLFVIGDTVVQRLLELLDDGAPVPAAVLGGPVGFVGSAQSKQELIDDPRGLSYLMVTGRRGGSAMAAAAVNAIATDVE